MAMAWLTVLGIPAAVYVVGITALVFNASEKPQQPLLLIGAGLLSLGIYMFHRSNAAPSSQMQERHRLALKHQKVLFRFSAFCIFLSIFLFAIYAPILIFLAVASMVGVIMYGRKCILQPVRNYLYVKPFAVGVSIALFAWTLSGFSNSILVVLGFMLLCSSDALLCDLSDRDYDEATGCTTLAKNMGSWTTWLAALVLYICSGVLIPNPFGLIFLVLFFVPLLFQNSQRTAIDLRPMLVLLIAWSL